MSRIYYKSVDVEVEIDLEDVLDFMNNANEYEMNEIANFMNKHLNTKIDSEFITFDNLYDREKVLILKNLFDKLNLDQLQELNWPFK